MGHLFAKFNKSRFIIKNVDSFAMLWKLLTNDLS